MTAVVQIIPSLGAGGAEQACSDIALGLKEAGHRSIIISSGGPREIELKRAQIKCIDGPVDSKNPMTILNNARWLTNYIREKQIDVIHARSRAPAWSAYLACRKTGCHFVTTFHAAYKFSNPFKKYYNSVMSKSDRVIAISHFIAKHIEETYGTDPAKIRTIPRGIDLERFAPGTISDERRTKLRTAWGISAAHPLILMPSRLSPIKGQSVLIEAIAKLPYQFENLHAVIVGDDQGRAEYHRELHNFIIAQGLQNRTKLAVHCDDMPAAYSLASLVIAPSLVPEGFGRVPVEAIAMGIPVIASDIGGFKETIQHGQTGWLVTPGDPQKLSDAIRIALTEPAEHRAAMAQAMQAARVRYDKRKMVADTLSVYDELMAEG